MGITDLAVICQNGNRGFKFLASYKEEGRGFFFRNNHPRLTKKAIFAPQFTPAGIDSGG